jgi:O-antigen/teichoic acid export membrane protein
MNEESTTAAAVSTYATRIATTGAGIVAAVITARYLGPEARGQYFAVITLSTAVSQVANLGFSSSNTFVAARDPGVVAGLVGNSLWISVLCAVLCVALVGSGAASSLIGGAVPDFAFWFVCLLAPASLLFQLISSVLVGARRFREYNRWQLINALLALGTLAAAASFDWHLSGQLGAVCAAALLTALLLFLGQRQPQGLRWHFEPHLVRTSLGFAARAQLALVLSFLLQRSGVWLLAHLGDTRELGYFSIAVQVQDALLILPTTISFVLFPSLVRGDHGAHRGFARAALYTVALTLLTCVAVAVIAHLAIGVAFGADYEGATPAVIALMPAVVLLGVTSLLSQYVVARGFPMSLVGVWLIALVLGAVAGWPLVSSLGARGAALAQSAGALTACLGAVALAWRQRTLRHVVA